MSVRVFLVFICCTVLLSFFFFFNDTATTEIYTLSLHDALPIYCANKRRFCRGQLRLTEVFATVLLNHRLPLAHQSVADGARPRPPRWRDPYGLDTRGKLLDC